MAVPVIFRPRLIFRDNTATHVKEGVTRGENPTAVTLGGVTRQPTTLNVYNCSRLRAVIGSLRARRKCENRAAIVTRIGRNVDAIIDIEGSTGPDRNSAANFIVSVYRIRIDIFSRSTVVFNSSRIEFSDTLVAYGDSPGNYATLRMGLVVPQRSAIEYKFPPIMDINGPVQHIPRSEDLGPLFHGESTPVDIHLM